MLLIKQKQIKVQVKILKVFLLILNRFKFKYEQQQISYSFNALVKHNSVFASFGVFFFYCPFFFVSKPFK